MDSARVDKASVGEPLADLSKGICVAVVCVDKHVHCKEETVERTGAILVYEELRDGDGSTGRKRLKDLRQQFTAALFTFAVKDVPKCGDSVILAKVGCEKVSFGESEAIAEVEAMNSFSGDGEDVNPVYGGDADVLGALRESDAPDSRASCKIEDADRLSGILEVESLSQRLGRWIAHRKYVHDELLEKVRACRFLINRICRFASGDNLAEFEPFGNQMLAGMENQPSLEAGLSAHKEGCAFRRERVGALYILGQKVEPYEGIHDGGKTADGRARGCVDFGKGLWTIVEEVEDVVANGRLQHERRNVAPGELHDTFGCNRRSTGETS